MDRKAFNDQKLLTLCEQLISQGNYTSQAALRRDLKPLVGEISLATTSRLLNALGVVKIQNARGERVYAIDAQHHPSPSPQQALADMVIEIVASDTFVLIHTAPGYSQAVARLIDCQHAYAILGVVAGNDNVWIAPRDCRAITELYRQLRHWLIVEEKN